MREIIIRDKVWYLALQDGPLNDVEYSTEAAAKEALKRLKKERRDLHLGTCVMSRVHEKRFVEQC